MYRVYIDEAGDRGHHPKSSRHFVVSAVVVKDAHDATARQELDQLRAALGRHPGQVLHFRNLTHSQKLKACQDLSGFSIEMVTNVIFVKPNLAGTLPHGGVAHIKQADPMYLYAVRLLLERVSWFIDEHGGGSSIVTFAHLTRFPASKLHNYRQALMWSPTQIRWQSFDGHQWRINHPSAIELLQVADTAASALFKAVEPDAYGNTEDRWLSDRPHRRGAQVTGTRAHLHLRAPTARVAAHPAPPPALPHRRRGTNQPPQARLRAGPKPPQRRPGPADLDRMGHPDLQPRHLHPTGLTQVPETDPARPRRRPESRVIHPPTASDFTPSAAKSHTKAFIRGK